MKKVDRMISLRSSTSSTKFNQEQCRYLADKSKIAVQSLHSYLGLPEAWHPPFVSDQDMAPSVEIFKLLFALGKEVESFIKGCCKNTWIQSAIMLASVSELHISSLGFNLQLCTMVFSAGEIIGKLPTLAGTEIASASEAEAGSVQEKAKLDEVKLTRVLIALIHSSKSDSIEWQLAALLLGRLNIAVPVSFNQSSDFKILFKNLEQLEMLGKGSFGNVHKARWLGAEVAMKTFFDPTSSDFKHEVSILDGLRHPNIVSLLWYRTDVRKCYMIVELMDGDLHSLMEKRLEESGFCGSPFSNLEALHIMLQVAEGMLFLHEKKIVHRDLKSHNVLVNCMKAKEGKSLYFHAKVADFGLSKTKENIITYSDQTENQGSTRWMAPETIKTGNDSGEPSIRKGAQDLKYPFKSDIYSFAMLCYEILTGNVPFPTESLAAVKRKVLDGDRPQIPDQCPDRLRRLIEECWSSEPSARPCFGHICAELRQFKYEHLLKSVWAKGRPCLNENETLNRMTKSALPTSSSSPSCSPSSSSSSPWSRVLRYTKRRRATPAKKAPTLVFGDLLKCILEMHFANIDELPGVLSSSTSYRDNMYIRELPKEFPPAKRIRESSCEEAMWQPRLSWDFDLSDIFPVYDIPSIETCLTVDLFSIEDSRVCQYYDDDGLSGWGSSSYATTKTRGASYREELIKRLSKTRRPKSSKQIWIESYTRRRRQRRASSARSSTSEFLI